MAGAKAGGPGASLLVRGEDTYGVIFFLGASGVQEASLSEPHVDELEQAGVRLLSHLNSGQTR